MNNHIKKLGVLGIVLAAILALIGLSSMTAAEATNGDEPCYEVITVVDEEAWTEVIPATEGQHYSWTGGRLDTTNPPTEVPPSDNWQANTSQEPHDNGQGNPATWVNDSLHYTANSKGHASWFYYTAGTPEQVIEHPEVTHEETVEVPCEKPDPVVTEASSTSYNCGDNFQTTTHTVTTQDWVLDGNEWVPADPTVVETITTEAHDVVPCEEEPPCPEEPSRPLVIEGCDNPPTEPPVTPVPEEPTIQKTPKSTPAVPVAVDAGI